MERRGGRLYSVSLEHASRLIGIGRSTIIREGRCIDPPIKTNSRKPNEVLVRELYRLKIGVSKRMEDYNKTHPRPRHPASQEG